MSRKSFQLHQHTQTLPHNSTDAASRARDVSDRRHKRNNNDGLVKLYNQRRHRYVSMTSQPDGSDVRITFKDQRSCTTCEFELVFLCHLAPGFFHACPLSRPFHGNSRSRLWVYSVTLFRSTSAAGHYLCLDRKGRVTAKSLDLTSKSQVLSCSFYNQMQSAEFNVLYNVRYPLDSARCRQQELLTWPYSPSSRSTCNKWFIGARTRHDNDVSVVRNRSPTRGALTIIDKGPLTRV